MNALRTRWSAYLDGQHRLPTGLVGRVVGERMLRQHTPETDWSTDLLKLAPTDRVLEIGFGAGRALAKILPHIGQGQVVGVDRSATMVHAASQRNHAALVRGQLALLRGDLASLPLRDGHFDKIVSIHTFYFWPDARAVCLQLIALLAPGGRLVITCATAQTLATGERVWWPIHQRTMALVQDLQRYPQIAATLTIGPDSRQFNNVAIVVDRGVG